MNWLWTVALKKAVARGVQAVIAILGSVTVVNFLNSIGVTIMIDPTLASAATYGVLEYLRNWLKNKLGLKFIP